MNVRRRRGVNVRIKSRGGWVRHLSIFVTPSIPEWENNRRKVRAGAGQGENASGRTLRNYLGNGWGHSDAQHAKVTPEDGIYKFKMI